MYPSGYLSTYGMASGVGAAILSLVAMGAVIALSIFCYVKFMGKDAAKNAPGTLGAKLADFFDMKTLYLERVIKVLYMICAVATAVFALATPFILWAASGRFLLFLAGIPIGIVALVLGEVLYRLGYEFAYMFIRMAGDTRAIRTNVEEQAAKSE